MVQYQGRSEKHMLGGKAVRRKNFSAPIAEFGQRVSGARIKPENKEAVKKNHRCVRQKPMRPTVAGLAIENSGREGL